MSTKRLATAFTFFAAVLLVVPDSLAKVTPHPLFSDGAVLQRNKPVPVWGVADDGERITVKIQDQEAATVAKGGKWMVTLKPLKEGGPFTMTIAGNPGNASEGPVEIKNVLVGEVWVCSGQSNMQFGLRQSAGSKEAISASADPMLRLFSVPRKALPTEQSDILGKDFPLKAGRDKWSEASPETTPNFSAVAYYFGRDLRKALNVPVGLIHSSYGGTYAEAWTRRSALESKPSLKSVFEADERAMAAYPTLMERHKAALEKHKAAVAEAKEQGKTPPPAPRAPNGPNSPNRPAVLYNAMIAPIVPYAIAGAIWYQGESNAGKAYQYQAIFTTMIESWRDAWNQGDFPFLFVQLAPYMKIVDKPGESGWAELREAQLKTSQAVPHTAMAVITDVGDENDVHPTRKTPVGARLALLARALVYGEKIDYSGPEYSGMDVDGNSIVLKFKHLGGGLEAKDGPLKGFAIAGPDHVFVNAEAEIKGDTIVVRSPSVPNPVAVRYGWANFPLGNLWNKAGLPASPFRTDDLPMSTRPDKEGDRK
jgi:sialate O-acetylesterase